MAYGRYFKKKVKQATKAAGKRYGISYGRKGLQAKKNSVMKIAKDLMWVKSRLNVEKKHVDTGEIVRAAVGQVDVNLEGFHAEPITPIISQGDGEIGARIGNSIKATGLVIDTQMIKQAGAVGPRRVKVMVVRTEDPSLTGDGVVSRLFDVNPLTGLRDYHSNLDYTELKSKRIKVLCTRNVYLPGDTVDVPNPQINKTLKIALKLNDVIRYAGDGDSSPEYVRYYVIFMADAGNRDTFAASTLPGVLIQNTNSGVDVNMSRRFWYVDN